MPAIETILAQVASRFKWATYANFVEYAFPAFVLSCLVVADARLLGLLKGSDFPSSVPQRLGALLGFLVCGVILLGWILYMVRYYALFPGYARGKDRFFLAAGGVLNDASSWPPDKRRSLGKFYIDILYNEFAKELRERALGYHVRWVCLAHLTINFLISAVALSAFQGWWWFAERRVDSGVLLVIGAHLPAILVLASSAGRRRTRCNEQILQMLTKNRKAIEKKTPQFLEYWRVSKGA